jgi:hypothetical protein
VIRRLSADAYRDKMLSLRARADVRKDWLQQRLEEVAPELMKREGLDMWLVVAREYNEDPVIMTLLPAPAMSARRRTILIFTLQDDGTVERLTLDRYGHKGFYESAWEPKKEGPYECLAHLVKERDPKRIGLNISETFAFADGLTHSEYESIIGALGEEYAERTTTAERLAVGWLEHRIEPELIVYPAIIALGHTIIAEAFSDRVIQPGITTTEDVVWWMRQKMLDLGLDAWFQPTIDIQAADQPPSPIGKKPDKEPRSLILPGDMLHCDMGFYYLDLATDQQQLAYVLRPDESDVPEGLKRGLAEGNRVQDIHCEMMEPGKTGNEVLADTLRQAEEEDLNAMIYTHAIGYHGHAAGPTIGLWDHQDGVPGRGDYELFDDTCYSIELNVSTSIPEWDGLQARFGLEEEAALTGGRMLWLDGRQERFHIIG